MKLRLFEYMNECSRVDLDNLVKWLNNVDCDCLVVKHDKDEREPHYHAFVRLHGARDLDDIAKQLKTDPQYIERIRSYKNALAYAFHKTKNSKDVKAPYGREAIMLNKNINVDEIFNVAEEYEEQNAHFKEIEDMLYDYGECKITKKKLFDAMDSRDYDRFALKYRKMKEFRQMKMKDRNMEVIYINGSSGSGKTTLAKFMAETMGYDYFVSGSGKDILDGYDKEECIILDDLRADVFTKAELFKLLDNNTNSSVKSRYANKDISMCKLMIITSVKAPHDLYNWAEDTTDSFKQLARRLQYKYALIQSNNGDIQDKIYEEKQDGNFKLKSGQVQANINDVFYVKGITKRIGGELMKQVFAKIRDSVDHKEEELPF